PQDQVTIADDEGVIGDKFPTLSEKLQKNDGFSRCGRAMQHEGPMRPGAVCAIRGRGMNSTHACGQWEESEGGQWGPVIIVQLEPGLLRLTKKDSCIPHVFSCYRLDADLVHGRSRLGAVILKVVVVVFLVFRTGEVHPGVDSPEASIGDQAPIATLGRSYTQTTGLLHGRIRRVPSSRVWYGPASTHCSSPCTTREAPGCVEGTRAPRSRTGTEVICGSMSPRQGERMREVLRSDG